MPVLVIPLLINTLIGGALWMSEISIALKVILTIVIVFKFSITVYSGLFCENNFLKIGGFIGCFLLNALLMIFGMVHGIVQVLIPSIILIVMFIMWFILPRVFVKEGKEGSK